MNYRNVLAILSDYLYYFFLVGLIPFLFALVKQFYLQEDALNSIVGFGVMLAVTALIIVAFHYTSKNSSKDIFKRESILLVIGIWLLTIFLAAIPFYAGGLLTSYLDAMFETTSGITTTGTTVITPKLYNKKGEVAHQLQYNGTKYEFNGNVAEKRLGKTVLKGLNAVPTPFLLWRSLLQWLGGMGIVVLFLTIMPPIGVRGRLLYQAEVAGPIKEGFTPRIKNTAFALWKIYGIFTLCEIILLKYFNANIAIFDAICLAGSTISTGGFSIHPESIAWYNSAATEWIVIIFMLIGSINFALYIHMFHLRFYKIYSPDFFIFIAVVLCSTLYVVFMNDDFFSSDKLRTALFQVVSFQTSSGFASADYYLWKTPVKFVLLMLAFIGGMAGSTCGGIKTTRIYLMLKIVKNHLRVLFRPQTVQNISISGTNIDQHTIATIFCFFIFIMAFFFFGFGCFVFSGIDADTACGLACSFINNTGSGIGVASAGFVGINFMTPFAKIVGMIMMLLGRLEFMTILFLFLPSFWEGR